ncbi:MAG: hypothetical protein ACHQDE_06595 [Acidimicrobiia bacterium]
MRACRIASGLLAVAVLAACTGTEHSVFQLGRVKPPVSAPANHPDAAIAPVDAGTVKRRIRIPDDDAGPGGPDPGLDPTVVFGWKESLPGQGTCKAGKYVGSFTCDVEGRVPDAGPVGGVKTLSGAVTFTLTGSPEEQVLTIAMGSLSGPFFGGSLTGKLDCIAKSFTGMTQDGTALLGQGMQGPVMLFPGFDAKLTGDFDDQSLVIEGTLMMMNMLGQSCHGTFRASVVP